MSTRDELLRKTRLFFSRSVVGPIFFGLIFGGVPFAIICASLGDRIVSVESFRLVLELTPVAIVVVVLGVLLGENLDYKAMLKRTFLASVAACVPLPVAADAIVMWYEGHSPFSLDNFPFELYFFLLWSSLVMAAGFCIAVLAYFLKRRMRKSSAS